MCPGMAAGAVSLRKSHDIVILSFCNIVKGQANEFEDQNVCEMLAFFSFPAFYTKKAGQLKFRLTLRSLLLIFNILYI